MKKDTKLVKLVIGRFIAKSRSLDKYFERLHKINAFNDSIIKGKIDGNMQCGFFWL